MDTVGEVVPPLENRPKSFHQVAYPTQLPAYDLSAGIRQQSLMPLMRHPA
jgi:hypothetical protein